MHTGDIATSLELYNDATKVKEKELNSLKLRIINELTNLGYEISHKGTIYLIDIIYTSYEKGIVENLTKEIYPVIAKKYNQSINNIKSNVIKLYL